MKTKSLFSVLTALMLVLVSVCGSYATNSISGVVRYSDNNELVTQGIVKAYTLDGVLVGSTGINSNGSYILDGLLEQQLDIIGLADIEPDAFVPTGYPNTTDLQYSEPISCSGTVINRDIYVERGSGGNAPIGTSSISGYVSVGGKPIADAVVHAKLDGNIVSYAVTGHDGSYVIEGLPQGNYIIGVVRIGHVSHYAQKHLKMDESATYSVELFPIIAASRRTSPQNFTLNQNYPNPFNPMTVLSYSLPVSGKVKLGVYNSAGQLVKEVVNQYQEAGDYKYEFNGSSLASGVYYYKIVVSGANSLNSSEFVQTKKMILVK